MVFIDGESVYRNALNVVHHKKLPNLYHCGIIIGFIFVKKNAKARSNLRNPIDVNRF